MVSLLVSDEIVCEAVVPVRVTATQAVAALLPEAVASLATKLAPLVAPEV